MKILVIGSGGREHALAWRLSQSPKVSRIFVAPGNAGTATEEGLENIPLTHIPDLVAFAQKENIAFTIVGPEAPLALGIVDEFRQVGLRIFGPTQKAAQLESSKDFAKQFMKRHAIPTAASETFTDPTLAHAYITQHGAPIVIKADGLAAGKGVVVAMDEVQAHAAIDHMLVDNRMGTAGARVVIEAFLEGEEASFIVLSDGRNALALATSQDHKRLKDGDQGPNTGGMGAYSPAPVITPALHAKVMREIIMPTLNGMQKEGLPYTGFLYAGLMISPTGELNTLEFNCRMGDPETQPILMRLKSDLVDLIEQALDGKLHETQAQWDSRVALGIVLAAHGYPDHPRQGDVIKALPANSEEAHVFHAGTTLKNAQIQVSGGRVLCVTALGHNVQTAKKIAYAVADHIHFDGLQMRRDIGHRAIDRK
ncbi:MAG: phosphoribosylamine--glycine ligase [Betaproteobacteria bacterium]